MNFGKPNILSKYLRHKEINEYLEYLSNRYPKIAKVRTIGHSFEGRPLKIITISKGDSTNKNCVFIDAGSHAREWISISVALYCIHQLVERKGSNNLLLNKFDFVIMPIVNADGYEYTHNKNRFWRKTRKPIPGRKYIGTDCNRNFDFHWEDASGNPRHYTYRGDKPFSEPETRAVKKILDQLRNECKFYMTLHSHAQAFLYPWAFTLELPARWKDLHKLAEIGHKAIKSATGTLYRYGSVSSLLHLAAGGSSDYAYGVLNIPMVIVMELPPGGSGFDPPPQEIRRIVKESWIGIRAMTNFVSEKYEQENSPTCSLIKNSLSYCNKK